MSVTTPSIEAFAKSLDQHMAGEVELDKGLFAQEGLDSVVAVEWLYSLEDEYDALLDEDAMNPIDRGTLRDLYDHLFATVEQAGA